MAVKASAQQTIIDITDAYNVYLTCPSYNFAGTTGAAKAASCTTQVVAMCGTDRVKAAVDATKCACPAGVSVKSDGDATSPTLTVSVTTAVTGPGKVTIPVTVDGVASFTLEFAFGVNLAGNGVASITEQYYQSTSSTGQAGGSWTAAAPEWVDGRYIWTRSYIKYTGGGESYTTPVCVTGGRGGTGRGIKAVDVMYYLSASESALSGGSWVTDPPAWVDGKYMWTKTVTTYTEGDPTETDPVCITGARGATGATGAGGLAMTITSSAGFIFKNSKISTTLTAHVYQGGAELTGTALAALGTVKWYKDGSTTASQTGQTFEVSATAVNTSMNVTAQLEG